MPASCVLVIEVGASHVAWARFRAPRRGRLVLEDVSFADLPPGPASETEVPARLQGVLRGAGEDRWRWPCAVAIPGQVAITKILRLPAVAASKRAKIIRFEVEQNVPFPLADVVWDHEVVARGVDEVEVLLVAAKRRLVAAVGGVLTAQRARLARIQPAATALLSAYCYCHDRKIEPAILVGVGAHTTHLILVAGARLFIRTLVLGGNRVTQAIAEELSLPLAEAEDLKLRLSGAAEQPPGGRAAAVVAVAAADFAERLGLEIGRSLASWRRHGDLVPAGVYLSGGGSLLPNLAPSLAAKLGLPVRRLDVMGEIDVAPGAAAASPEPHRMAELVGLAANLRSERSSSVNLLPARLRMMEAVRDRLPWWMGHAAVLAVGLALAGVHYQRLGHAAEAAAGRFEESIEPLVALRVRNEEASLRLAALQRDIDGLSAALGARHAWIGFLQDIQERMNSVGDAWIDRLQVIHSASPGSSLPHARRRLFEGSGGAPAAREPARLLLAGRLLDRAGLASRDDADAPERVHRMLQMLRESSFVTRVEQERFEALRPGVLRFELALVLNLDRPL